MGTEKLGADRGSSEPEPFSAAFKLGRVSEFLNQGDCRSRWGVGCAPPRVIAAGAGTNLCAWPFSARAKEGSRGRDESQ